MAHTPTEETNAQVRALCIAGIPAHGISKVLGIGEIELRENYGGILESALYKMIADVSNCVLQKAMNGDNTCLMFLLQTKGRDFGWAKKSKEKKDQSLFLPSYPGEQEPEIISDLVRAINRRAQELIEMKKQDEKIIDAEIIDVETPS